MYELEAGAKLAQPTHLERVRTTDSIAARVEHPPAFVSEPYPFCPNDGGKLPEYL